MFCKALDDRCLEIIRSRKGLRSCGWSRGFKNRCDRLMGVARELEAIILVLILSRALGRFPGFLLSIAGSPSAFPISFACGSMLSNEVSRNTKSTELVSSQAVGRASSEPSRRAGSRKRKSRMPWVGALICCYVMGRAS
jgi:hypothetical protein